MKVFYFLQKVILKSSNRITNIERIFNKLKDSFKSPKANPWMTTSNCYCYSTTKANYNCFPKTSYLIMLIITPTMVASSSNLFSPPTPIFLFASPILVLSSFPRSSFFVSSTPLWNSLSESLVGLSSYLAFKRYLKLFLQV